MYKRQPEQAKLSFSTVHRAKGKEWDAVQLADDFLNPADEELLRNLDESTRIEESNILYVAVTRARKKIMYSPELLGWFEGMTTAEVDVSHRMKPKAVKKKVVKSQTQAKRAKRKRRRK